MALILRLFAAAVLTTGALFADVPATATVALFNGRDFSGLHVFVENSTVAISEAWKIEEGLLRATGVGRGYVRTVLPYADYKLSVDWRWPKGKGNSGILIHIVNDDRVWPKSIECQLLSERAGDFAFFSDARAKEELVSRNPKGFSTGRLVRPGPSAEKPLGEWNTFEVTAAGDTVTLVVNGTEVNRMTGVIPSAGFIGLQSEGAAIDFRNLKLTLLPAAKDLNAPMPATK